MSAQTINHVKLDRDVTILSDPQAVNMADEWFDIANLNHFWTKRRFDVLTALLRRLSVSPGRACEIGCGHGLVQRQIEDRFGIAVDGIDLNLSSLKASISGKGKLFCYDIFEERPEFRETYDFLILFDVLEHIEDQLGFLTLASNFVRPGGSIAINVPARQELFSAFDVQVGHVRRYSLESLLEVVAKAGLNEKVTTYWGFPLVPLLWVRKIMLRGARGAQVIQAGFSPRGALVNHALTLLAGLEWIPSKTYGTGLMMIAEKPKPEPASLTNP
jgi:SAM-dependent methyltransferase